MELSLPSGRTRLRLIDAPEICLIAAVVVAARHFLPFPTRRGTSSTLQDKDQPHMDWHRWNDLMRPVVENHERKTPAMTPEDFDGECLANADEATFDAMLALLSADQGEIEEEGRLRCFPSYRCAS